ncbi:MAG: hypothetical protein AB7N65_10425 [Vicinamibacterales bacterium]
MPGKPFADTLLGKRQREVTDLETTVDGESPFALARRGTGQDLMLELRFRNGGAASLAYAYLVRADYRPETGIHLQFSVCEVLIEGSNLRPLYGEIISHRRSFVEEDSSASRLAKLADSTTPTHVERITIRDVEEEKP